MKRTTLLKAETWEVAHRKKRLIEHEKEEAEKRDAADAEAQRIADLTPALANASSSKGMRAGTSKGSGGCCLVM